MDSSTSSSASSSTRCGQHQRRQPVLVDDENDVPTSGQHPRFDSPRSSSPSLVATSADPSTTDLSTANVGTDNPDPNMQRQRQRQQQQQQQYPPPLPHLITSRTRRKTSTIFYPPEDKEYEDVETIKGVTIHHRPSSSTATTETTTDTTAEPHPPNELMSFVCGLSAGVVQAGLFNPFDRALYLSVTQHRPFLSWKNFQNPYLGFMQSVGHRALSGGLYFPLENLFCRILLMPSSSSEHKSQQLLYGEQSTSSSFFQNHPAFANFVAGTLAGSAQALICNPISALKYKSWSRSENRGIVVEASEMFRKGGLRPFCNGLIPTLSRDFMFGGTYTFLRLELQYRFQLEPHQQWLANMVAASIATVLSGPFNLARNVQYATKSRKIADGVIPIFKDLMKETLERPTALTKYKYLQTRLRIGAGTIRVAVGMSFGQVLYDKLMGIVSYS